MSFPKVRTKFKFGHQERRYKENETGNCFKCVVFPFDRCSSYLSILGENKMLTVAILMKEFVRSGWEIVFAVLGDISIILLILYFAGKLPL